MLAVLNTSSFTPTLSHQIALPAAYGAAAGVTLSHDGKQLYIASGPGLIVVDTKLAAAGSSNAIIGTLNGTTSTQQPGRTGAIEVTLTHNNEYAFVSQEYGANATIGLGNIDVFELAHHANNNTVTGTPIGFANVGLEVVGSALGPHGDFLYATAENETNSVNDTVMGYLNVLDVAKLKTNPSEALLRQVPAGCGPVRVIISSDGKVVWMTARESNHLLAFNATRLQSKHPHEYEDALIASIQVGTSPVGLAFVKNETRILTADSNRFGTSGNATSSVSVVDVQAALSGVGQPVLGRVPAGLFPREVAVSPDGNTVLVADYDSRQVQAIDVRTLP